MKATIAILIVLGLIAAVSASVLVASLRVDDEPPRVVEPVVNEVELVVASADLPASTIVDRSAMTTKRVPESQAPAGYVTREKAMGRALILPMVEGQVFKRDNFARDSSGFRLAAVLPSGMRAMSVTLSESAALDGMLHPGSRVDVIASFQADNPAEESSRRVHETLSTVLLEDVQVLAVQDRTIVSDGEETSAPAGSGRRRMVTLMVDGKQAEALQLAAAHGNISLTLRNPLDPSGMPARGTLFSDLSHMYADRLGSLRSIQAASLVKPLELDSAAQIQPEPAVSVSQPEAGPAPQRVWQTIITRGMNEQTLEFPLADTPEHKDPVQPVREADRVSTVDRRSGSDSD